MEFWQHSNPYTALFLFTAEMESFKRNLGRCGIKTGNEIVGAKGGPPRRVPGGQLEDGEAGTRKLVSKPKPRQRLLSGAFKREMKRWNTVPGQHGCVDPAEATCKIINCNFGFDTSIRVFSLFIPLLLFFGRVPGHLPAPPASPSRESPITFSGASLSRSLSFTPTPLCTPLTRCLWPSVVYDTRIVYAARKVTPRLFIQPYSNYEPGCVK